MVDHGHYCPFLNHADARCSGLVSLERLNHAFDCCFGQFRECPVFTELAEERRERRQNGAGPSREAAPLVQVTFSNGSERRAAGVAVTAASLGL